jgi:UPF0271 protein
MTDAPIFDINCDIGESYGNWRMGRDEEIMPLITTANVACGFHGGDPVTMAATVDLALRHDVAIGAHPGFPDLMGFGRRAMAVSPEDAAAYITYQAGALQAFLHARGATLHHVKPHGAFYAVLRDDESLAAPAAQAIRDLSDDIMVYWPAPTENVAFIDEVRSRGIEVVAEIYPDLSYTPEGRIAIQRAKHETDIDFAVHQVQIFLERGVVEANDGSEVALKATSACVHSDGANAAEVAQAIRDTVTAAGHKVAALQPTGAGAPS